ncbi:hypothetical protein [Candidatus Villigracilis affinis]|uniref:hypothetical protein n=1 Tax=Candidatus Villigracilis affinis TaxID=3140682 RepID=UPI001E14B380|nr:hypothetical protein [Anaerolineales bacterium]
MNTIISISAFAILTILWLGFGYALAFNQAILYTIWQSFRGMPFVVQLIVGFLILPVVLGLWIWESSWPLWIRLILVLGLGFATIYTFFPKQS